jgi:hypothetical protein
MTKRIVTAIILSAVALFAGSTPADAAGSYRGGTLSWAPTATPFEVEFRLRISQRLDDQQTGDAFAASIAFGDGQSAIAPGTVISVNTAEEWFIAEVKVRHTYGNAGPFTAFVNVCCRMTTGGNGGNGSLRLETLVRPDSGNSSPVTALPGIVTVPLTNAATFTVPAADANNDTLRFRFATNLESGVTPPAGMAIGLTTGIITWNPIAAGANTLLQSLWTAQVIVEDRDSLGAVKSTTPVEVVLQIVAVAGVAPVLTLDPAPAGTLAVAPGSTLTFDVVATDADAAALVTLHTSGLPAGASVSPALDAVLPAPATSTFSWTPTLSDVGTYVIAFAATDDSLQQTMTSVKVRVAVNAPPVLQACAAPVTVAATSVSGAVVTLDNAVSDADGDGLAITWKIGSTLELTENLAAGSTAQTAIDFEHIYAVGTYSVVLTATDSGGASASCTTSVTVTPAGLTSQTITFGALSPVTYGVAPATLTATASSGLPVTFTRISGPATIVNGLLTVTGAGSVVVRANQAGDATYAAAASVDRTLVVNPAALTVKANDATKTYGAALPTFGVTYTGLVTGDTSVSLGGALAFNTTVTTATVPGTYAVAPSGVTSSNYTITFTPGVFTVTKAPLTVTAGSATISVDAALPVFTAQTSGFVLGETASVLGGTLAFTVPAGAASVAGTYAVTPGGLTSDTYAFTYVPGVLTVTGGVCEFQATENANSGRTIVIRVSLCSPTGRDLSSESVRLTVSEIIGPGGASITAQGEGNSNPGGVFRKTGKTYSFNLKTTGLASGAYQLKFRVSGDPVPQTVRFSIR